MRGGAATLYILIMARRVLCADDVACVCVCVLTWHVCVCYLCAG
jgi:hypothetical protein